MNSPYILVVDDEEDIGDLIKDILEDEGFEVEVALNGEQARLARKKKQPTLVLLDIWMPDIDGISLLTEWYKDSPTPPFPVIMMSGHGTLEHAIEATKLGAFDFLEKPLTLAKLVTVVKRALEAKEQVKGSPTSLKLSPKVIEPVGRSKVALRLKDKIKQISESGSRPVMISGESGTGKNLYAHYLHSLSERKNAPIISINLAHVTRETIESIFLGSETGGKITHGLFEKAESGTLLLQNISELDLGTQDKLAIILDSMDYMRVNGRTPLRKNISLISTSREELDILVKEGDFREDLFYQINVLPVTIPPLRERQEDVPDLIAFYVHFFVEEEHLTYRHFSIAAQNRLRNHSWPGNIRELKSLVQQLLILGHSDEISLDEINAILTKNIRSLQALSTDQLLLDLPLREAREQFERAYLIAQVKECEGNIAKLADKVGMERTNLYRKLKSLDIDPKKIVS